MKRNAAFVSLVVVAALLLAPLAQADRKPWSFDRAHSEINFVAEALLLTAHGFFGTWEGDIQLDPDNLENSAIKIEIDAASINTRNERRDNHLRSADFFDAQNHPKITFVSSSIKKLDDKSYNLTGDITIRGVTKSIVMPVRVVFLRDGRARFKSEFSINRRDFGINYNSNANPIEDAVAIQLDLNLRDTEAMERQRQQRQQQQPAKPGR